MCVCVCIDFGVDYNRINSLQSDIGEYTLFSHAYFMLLSKLTLYVCPVVGSVQETCNFDTIFACKTPQSTQNMHHKQIYL